MVGVTLEIDQLAVAHRKKRTASACAIAADVGVLFSVHELPVAVRLNSQSRRLLRQLERHARRERCAGGFHEAPACQVHNLVSPSKFSSSLVYTASGHTLPFRQLLMVRDLSTQIQQMRLQKGYLSGERPFLCKLILDLG